MGEAEQTLAAWQDAGGPGIASISLRITQQAHVYRIGDHPSLRWEHRLT
ncbi:hypothetical protein [Streptomyces sp. Amel2xC10]|nr:hypothetical protein [Streptomyces sp. Amel2xC10]